MVGGEIFVYKCVIISCDDLKEKRVCLIVGCVLELSEYRIGGGEKCKVVEGEFGNYCDVDVNKWENWWCCVIFWNKV